MSRIEVQVDFEVGGADAKAFVGFSFDAGGTGGFGGDGAGHQFLRDEHGESLRATLGPIVEAGENAVLVIKVVVEDGNERSAEGESLIEGMRALYFERHFCDTVDK